MCTTDIANAIRMEPALKKRDKLIAERDHYRKALEEAHKRLAYWFDRGNDLTERTMGIIRSADDILAEALKEEDDENLD